MKNSDWQHNDASKHIKNMSNLFVQWFAKYIRKEVGGSYTNCDTTNITKCIIAGTIVGKATIRDHVKGKQTHLFYIVDISMVDLYYCDIFCAYYPMAMGLCIWSGENRCLKWMHASGTLYNNNIFWGENFPCDDCASYYVGRARSSVVFGAGL